MAARKKHQMEGEVDEAIGEDAPEWSEPPVNLTFEMLKARFDESRAREMLDMPPADES